MSDGEDIRPDDLPEVPVHHAAEVLVGAALLLGDGTGFRRRSNSAKKPR